MAGYSNTHTRGHTIALVRCRAVQGGVVRSSTVRANSTFTVLPRAVHQLANLGQEDLQIVVALSDPPLRVSPPPALHAHPPPRTHAPHTPRPHTHIHPAAGFSALRSPPCPAPLAGRATLPGEKAPPPSTSDPNLPPSLPAALRSSPTRAGRPQTRARRHCLSCFGISSAPTGCHRRCRAWRAAPQRRRLPSSDARAAASASLCNSRPYKRGRQRSKRGSKGQDVG